MAHPEPMRLAAIPGPLRWGTPPPAWTIDAGRELRISAGPQTDLFLDPQGTTRFTNAPRLLFEPTGDFVLQARVTVEFAATFDAGVLLVYGGETAWAKLCFEFSPQQQPMVVSVVTRDYSDDANSVILQEQSVLLRVARLGQAFAFHWSTDGGFWHFVRHFTLPDGASFAAGFASQSPTGDGCQARFTEISFREERLLDLRSGV